MVADGRRGLSFERSRTMISAGPRTVFVKSTEICPYAFRIVRRIVANRLQIVRGCCERDELKLSASPTSKGCVVCGLLCQQPVALPSP